MNNLNHPETYTFTLSAGDFHKAWTAMSCGIGARKAEHIGYSTEEAEEMMVVLEAMIAQWSEQNRATVPYRVR